MPTRVQTLPDRAAADPGPTVSIFWIGRQLCPNYGKGRLVTYLRLLVGHHGFPAPLPQLAPRRREGNQPAALTTDVTLRSFWRRDAVETWLSDFLPPDLGAAIDRRAQARAAHDMDAAAMQLGQPALRLVAGGRS